MSKGYTPVFSTIYDGTLCGKWPAAAVFASILPLCDAEGTIDMSQQAIASRTGWPLELLQQGLDQLMAPDHLSRSTASEGRRLELLDPRRPWGWRVVNAEKYREKARLMGKNAREVASGSNAARMAGRSPPAPPEDRKNQDFTRRPPETAGDRPSYTDRDSEGYHYVESSPQETQVSGLPLRCGAAEKRSGEVGNVPLGTAPPDPKLAEPSEPPREEVWERCRAAYPKGVWQGTPHETMGERAVERLLEEGIPGSLLIDSCVRYALQAEAAGRIGTTYVRGIGKHFSEGWWKSQFPLPRTRGESDQDRAVAAARRFVARGEAGNARH